MVTGGWLEHVPASLIAKFWCHTLCLLADYISTYWLPTDFKRMLELCRGTASEIGGHSSFSPGYNPLKGKDTLPLCFWEIPSMPPSLPITVSFNAVCNYSVKSSSHSGAWMLWEWDADKVKIKHINYSLRLLQTDSTPRLLLWTVFSPPALHEDQ